MNEFDLTHVGPEAMGLCPIQWERILTHARELCDSRKIPALSLQVQRHGLTTSPRHFGTLRLNQTSPVTDDTLFLTASLTKPMVALAVLMLVERGQLSLSQQAREFLPEIRDPAKRLITIKHLLTHTSGLPDQLPDNAAMRLANAPLSEFVSKTCAVDLLFPPGRTAQYQSMGYVWLGQIIEVISGMSCRDFLQRELFAPLQMNHSFLGLPAEPQWHDRVAEIDLPSPAKEATTGNWNSRYWRELGAPWGGVFSTCHDLSRFLQMVLRGARSGAGSHGLLSQSSLRESLENRLGDFSAIPGAERRTRGWGLGWRLNWKDHRSTFCDILPAGIAGHWGATGTLFWLDPAREIGVVLLSTRPLDDGVSPLTPLSNMIAAAFTED